MSNEYEQYQKDVLNILETQYLYSPKKKGYAFAWTDNDMCSLYQEEFEDCYLDNKNVEFCANLISFRTF